MFSWRQLLAKVEVTNPNYPPRVSFVYADDSEEAQ